MKYADEVMDLMEKIMIASGRDVGELLVAWGFYGEKNNSGWNNANKILNYLTSLGKLERGDGFYRLPGCRSEFKEHAKILTRSLVEVLKKFPDARIIRETEITAVRLVPDALALLIRGEKGRVMILEAVNFEFPQFLQQKIDVWTHWDGALKHLTDVFGSKILSYDFVVFPESPIDGVWSFQEFMEDAERQ